jgi:tmRNA-binding protein
MLRLLLFFISFSAFAGPRVNYPPGGFQDNFWQQVQIQHIQTQQQLQSQDQYRRQLLLQDQQRQIEQLQDQQSQFEFTQRNSIMHQHSDRLKMYSNPGRGRSEIPKKKSSKVAGVKHGKP